MTFGRQGISDDPAGNPEALRRLREIPNVGPKVAAKFVRVGITDIPDLAGRDPDELYERLCAVDGVHYDDRMRDIFAAAIAFAEGLPSRPWSAFTAERKKRDAARMAGPERVRPGPVTGR